LRAETINNTWMTPEDGQDSTTNRNRSGTRGASTLGWSGTGSVWRSKGRCFYQPIGGRWEPLARKWLV